MILDTNALSAIADGEEKAVRIFNAAEMAAIPVVALGEFRYGIRLSRRRQDYELWLSESLRICPVLDVSDQTAGYYADLRIELRRAGTPIPSNDVWIAALARQHSFSVLSRDRHFDVVSGIRRVGW